MQLKSVFMDDEQWWAQPTKELASITNNLVIQKLAHWSVQNG